MTRTFVAAAFAALLAGPFAASTSALAFSLSPGDREICPILELAHESTCAELESVLKARHPAAYVPHASLSGETTGSISSVPGSAAGGSGGFEPVVVPVRR